MIVTITPLADTQVEVDDVSPGTNIIVSLKNKQFLDSFVRNRMRINLNIDKNYMASIGHP
jgi:hypothetical protein